MEKVNVNSKFEIQLPEQYLKDMNVKSGDFLILKCYNEKIFCCKE